MSNPLSLPFLGILAEIADLIGEEAARKIEVEYAGSTMYVPSLPRAENQLCHLIGLEKTRILSVKLGSGHIPIPAGSSLGAGRRRALAQHLRDAGYSVRHVSKIADVSERTVYRSVHDRLPALPLFDYLTLEDNSKDD